MKVIKQRDLKDCGVCCLASIIKHYGGNVSLERLRLDTHTDATGTNALNLINASKKYGFEAMGVKISNIYNENIKLPAIAHVTSKKGLEHFVVIYKITVKNVYLMDPAKGKIIMTVDDFDVIWNNILILFYPKMPIIFLPKENTLGKLLMEILKKEKKLFIIILISSILFSIFTIIDSYYFKITLEAVVSYKEKVYLMFIVIIFGSVLVFKLLFNNLRKYLLNHFSKNVDVYIISDFIKYLFNIPLEAIVSRTSGEITTRMSEIMNIKTLITDIFLAWSLDSILMIASLPILYLLNDKLFMILVFVFLSYLLIGIISTKLIYERAYQNIEKEADFNNCLQEQLKLIYSLKNLNRIDFALKKLEEKGSYYLYDNYNLMKIINLTNNLKIATSEIGVFLINTLGLVLIYKDIISISDLITFNTLSFYFLDPIKNIVNCMPKFSFMKATFTKINDFLGLGNEKLGDSMTFNNWKIEITNLSYRYNDYNLVLDKVNLKIKDRDFVLLKGQSGQGKSTLCKLLMKQLTGYEGTIKIGDYNLLDCSLKAIRENIVYVSQNEAIFTGTIKENILMSRPIRETDFFEVCKICQIEKIIMNKPLRYETLISNDVTYLSGGERQRIILARALLEKASIYLIDEALSEVDYEMEKEIINNLKQYLQDKTVIYITHKKQDDLFTTIIDLNQDEIL